ncbi:hypothetical protein AM587_10002602 [Phytophthora nicotianae]|uniref:Uncharacterized protein n=1 Tax=Phytophthora nicotianae TaxID=4792 RepID=A0A0W8CYQ5_PHYNI|nr:hypothetical protein AM587_10002602 [Phytophthora nicotianae]
MSSDGSAFVDLTSSQCSSPRSAARGGPATVSTVALADPSLDLAGVRASLSALQLAIDQTEALRREFLATRRRAEDLDRQLADAANAASPFVLFYQHMYEVDRVSTLDRDLLQASQRVRAAISQRDQARAERIATQDRVSAARDTISRLEKRINQVAKSQQSRGDLELALAALQQERDGLVVQRDELLGSLAGVSWRSPIYGPSGTRRKRDCAASDVGAHSDGGESSSGKSSSTRVFDSDAVGSDSGSP